MKDKINSSHSLSNASDIAYIAEIKLQFRMIKALPHVVLLLFVTTKHSNLRNIALKESMKNRASE